MFVVLLRFSHNKDQANAFMDGHNQWIRRGFEDKVFLMVGSLQPGPSVVGARTSGASLGKLRRSP